MCKMDGEDLPRDACEMVPGDHARIGPAVELTAQAVAAFEGQRFFLSRFLGFGSSQVIFWFSQIVSKPYHTFFSFGDESRI